MEQQIPQHIPLDIETGEMESNVVEADLDYSPRMDDFERQFMQLNRMVSSAEDDDDDLEPVGESDHLLSNFSEASAGSSKSKTLHDGSGAGQAPLITGDVGGIDDTADIDFEIWESSEVPQPPPFTESMPVLEGSELDLEIGIALPEGSQEDNRKPSNLLSSLLPPYEEKFKEDAAPVRLVISKIPEDILKAQQAAMDAAASKRRMDILEATKKRERSLLQREHLARARLEQMESDTLEKLRREKELLRLADREREQKLGLQFRQAREEMEQHLAAKDAGLREVFGEVRVDQKMARRFTVEWDRTPQPIEMRIHCLRACKNKLPKGAYVLMLSQRERLGGAPLVWSRIGAYGIGENHPATTRPVKHYGRYFDRTMKVEDSVYALCPPKNQIKPSNVFVLELFQLAGRSNPTDKVVAWSAMPISNAHFIVVNGKFRLPLLRGEPSPSIQHFKTMESLMAEDLSTWLCNIYIEIRHIPRTMLLEGMVDAKTEYEIEFDFMSKLLNLGGRVAESGAGGEVDKKLASDGSSGDEEDFRRKSVARAGKEVDLNLFNRKLYHRRRRRSSTVNEAAMTQKALDSHGINQPGISSTGTTDTPRKSMLNAKGGGGASGWWTKRNKVGPVIREEDDDEASPVALGRKTKPLLALAKVTEDRIAQRLLGSSSDESSDDDDNNRVPMEIRERGYDRGEEFFLHNHQRGKLTGIETLSTAKERQWAAAGIENGGAVIRKMTSDGIRLDSDVLTARKEREQTGDISQSWTIPLTDQKEFDHYTMSLTPDVAQTKRILPDALVKSKLRYLYFEAFGDLLPGQWGTFDCYVTAVVFVMAFWMRMFVHYIGQYLFLQAFRTPVYSFEVRVYEIVFKYMSSSIPVSVEFGVVVMGPLGNLFVLICMSFLASFFYRYAKYLPDTISQFVAAYGIATFCDPLFIFLVDVIMHNYNCTNVDEDCKHDYTSRNCECFDGDFMKLWNRMEKDENSGMTGLMITLMVYTGTSVLALLVLYEYLINTHKNARILDIWRRVSAPSEEFFIPHDFEVSYDELTSIIARAKIWRGPQGSTRKVVVSEYQEKDPYDVEFDAITKHFAIYELEMDGKRTLHRHFLMLPDGAIIEIFDQLSLDLSNQFKSLERLLGDVNMGCGEGRAPAFPKAKKNVSLFAGMEQT